MANAQSEFLRAVEEAFDLLDSDANREIGAEEFCALARSLNIDLDSSEALTLLRTALGEQTDDDRAEAKLTVDHFSALMLRHVGSNELNEELRRTFDAFDVDGDGRISRRDLDQLREEKNFFERLDEEQYQAVLKEFFSPATNCAEKSAGIDFEQFVRLMMPAWDRSTSLWAKNALDAPGEARTHDIRIALRYCV